MPEYAVGDVAEDVQPGLYDGLGEAYCPPCQGRWIEDEKREHFNVLATEVESGAVIARRATWRYGALKDRRERGLIVTRAPEPPLLPDDIRALAELPERAGWPSFAARLSDAGVTLWVGRDRITPPDMPVSDSAHRRWWLRHVGAVQSRLRDLGWRSGVEHDRQVKVEITGAHRVQIKTE
jgi:hypothetical protein